jgi:glutathione S-transferase
MRARMALKQANIACDIIDISLKQKPQELLTASPKGTVPVLILKDGTIIDESLDIMNWALHQNDPDNWLGYDISLIHENDSWFKHALDCYKYPMRYPYTDCTKSRSQVEKFFIILNQHLLNKQFLSSHHITFSDIAIFPFIRQAANHDKAWFLSLPYANLQQWLDNCLNFSVFNFIFNKNLQKI